MLIYYIICFIFVCVSVTALVLSVINYVDNNKSIVSSKVVEPEPTVEKSIEGSIEGSIEDSAAKVVLAHKQMKKDLKITFSGEIIDLPNSKDSEKETVEDSTFLKDFLGDVVYINLDEAKERKKNFEKEMQNIFFKEDGLEIKRFPAVRKSNGALGCLLSHINCLTPYAEHSSHNIFVCEDDLTLFCSREEFKNTLKFVESSVGDDWDVIMVGQYVYNWQRVVKNGEHVVDKKCKKKLMRLLDAKTTSGYIVNKRYINTLLKLWRDHLDHVFFKSKFISSQHLDQKQLELQETGRWFGFDVPLGGQRDGYSFIEDKTMHNRWDNNGSLTEFIAINGNPGSIILSEDYVLD